VKQVTLETANHYLYNLYMKEISISEARERIAEVIDESQRTGKPISLTKRGKSVAILVAPDVFESLSRDAEDAFDRAAVALASDEEDLIPWEEVKDALGLA
jgi:antitoxin Phd